MPFSRDGLQKIKDEITNDPQSIGYAGKTPSAIAILITTPVSYSPPQYQQVKESKMQILTSSLSQEQIDAICSYAIAQGYITFNAFDGVPVEIKARRSDFLGLGDIDEGDIQSALAL